MKSISTVVSSVFRGDRFSNGRKNAVLSKKIVMLVLVALMVVSQSFAAETSITALDDWGDKILQLFSSSWVKVLCLVALIVEAIGMIVAGQQGGGGQIIKKFAPWIIGTIILLSASSICSYFLGELSFEVSAAPAQIEHDVAFGNA